MKETRYYAIPSDCKLHDLNMEYFEDITHFKSLSSVRKFVSSEKEYGNRLYIVKVEYQISKVN